jgi:outer membrane lipoprotein-sorting protein
MKKIVSLCLKISLLSCLAVSPGFGQKASDILEKMIEARGGKKILEGIRDMTLSGTMNVAQTGMSGMMTIYYKRPDKLRQDIEVRGAVFTSLFDGKTAWRTNPQTGNTEELSGKDIKKARRNALDYSYAALLHPERFGIFYTFKNRENIGSKDYFVLEQTFPDSSTTALYVDSQTYLIYKTKTTSKNPMTGMEAESETLVSGYKKVDGVLVAHAITVYYDGVEFATIAVTGVKLNRGLEDSLFKPLFHQGRSRQV